MSEGNELFRSVDQMMGKIEQDFNGAGVVTVCINLNEYDNICPK